MKKEARYKLLKMQFNDLCKAGIMLENDEVNIFSGLTTVQITDKDIHLQPAPQGGINLTSATIRQPMARQSTLPADYLPGIVNLTPRKFFDLPIEEEMKDLKELSVSLGGFLT